MQEAHIIYRIPSSYFSILHHTSIYFVELFPKMDAFSGLDVNGVFKVANLAVAALSVCSPLKFSFSYNIILTTGVIWTLPVIQWHVCVNIVYTFKTILTAVNPYVEQFQIVFLFSIAHTNLSSSLEYIS